MKASVLCAMVGVLVAASGAASARSRPYVPEPGDTSLRSKCRSEASMMGGGGGRGVVQYAMSAQEARRAYFKRCMQGG